MPRRATELTFKTEGWSCPVTCRRCTHTTKTGTRCKNKVCIGLPLCSRHNSLVYGVQIKPSTIKNSGKGLFATRALSRDSWVCPYEGEVLPMSCIHKRYPNDTTAPYTEQIPGNRNQGVDAACERGIGSMANGKFNANGTVSSINNHNCIVRYRPVGAGKPGLWLKTTKTIPEGSEIFLWYGDGGYRLENNHSTGLRNRMSDTRPC